MNALVVTSSVVVAKLLSLTFEKNGIESEIVDNLDKASSNDYSVILVDDIIENINDVINEIKNDFDYIKLVLIGNNEELAKECDLILKKPFIANDVESLLEEVDFSDDLIFNDEDDDIAQISQDDEDESISELIKNAKESQPKVLDPQEIERIKALMTLDKSEDDILDEISYIDKIKHKESFRLKTKEAKRFFKELKNVKNRELKRLLKGAKIRVKIEFEQDI